MIPYRNIFNYRNSYFYPSELFLQLTSVILDYYNPTSTQVGKILRHYDLEIDLPGSHCVSYTRRTKSLTSTQIIAYKKILKRNMS
jgi:hypothetical protein